MKKIISIFVLVVMVCSILSGCSLNIVTPNESAIGDSNEEKDLTENENYGEHNEHPEHSEENNTAPGNTEENNNVLEENKDVNNENNEQPENNNPPNNAVVGTKIGDIMKGIELQKINSTETVSVEDYRGKIIIFNLWATWCPPCVNELPHFEEFASDYADDVVIIAAHVSDNNVNASSYVSTNFPNSSIIFAYDTLTDDGYIAAGGDGYVPYTVILDRNGVIVYSDSGPLTYEQLKAF